MGRTAAMIAAAGLLGGCGGTSLLLRARQEPQVASPAHAVTSRTAYLAALESEQQRLAAAERRLPRHPVTPRQLAGAIRLLRGAIARLADDLSGLRAPDSARRAHARLIAVMREYATRLSVAARDARRPGGEARAAAELLSATGHASRTFSATITEIDRSLRQ